MLWLGFCSVWPTALKTFFDNHVGNCSVLKTWSNSGFRLQVLARYGEFRPSVNVS